jgi:ABC-type antimicrobial peptide transport system permease subunit
VLWLVALSVIAGLLGLAAAVIPAWRAGRMNVLEAISTE